MGVETKKMAKSMAATADENSLTGRLKSWPERVKTFYNDVRTEMKKVTAPSFKEVQATTVGGDYHGFPVRSVFLGRR